MIDVLRFLLTFIHVIYCNEDLWMTLAVTIILWPSYDRVVAVLASPLSIYIYVYIYIYIYIYILALRCYSSILGHNVGSYAFFNPLLPDSWNSYRIAKISLKKGDHGKNVASAASMSRQTMRAYLKLYLKIWRKNVSGTNGFKSVVMAVTSSRVLA